MVKEDKFKIYIDRLKDGKIETLEEEFSPDFLELQKEDLQFKKSIFLNGEAYIVDNELIIHYNVNSIATLPCVICNNPVEIPLTLENMYHIESIDNIKSGIYFYDKPIREAILLESPKFAECHSGKCPMRSKYADYLGNSQKRAKDKKVEEGYYQPFADLNIDE